MQKIILALLFSILLPLSSSAETVNTSPNKDGLQCTVINMNLCPRTNEANCPSAFYKPGATNDYKDFINPTWKPVTTLQKFLINTGYLPKGSAIGNYGPLTEKAIQRFQTQYKLTKDTYGFAGPQTRAFIKNLSCNLSKVLPDLTLVGDIKISTTTNPLAVLAEFTIQNMGHDVASSTNELSSSPKATISPSSTNTCVNTPSLQPEQSCLASYDVVFPKEGKKDLVAKVDQKNKIKESLETNNTSKVSFTMPLSGKTPTITGITPYQAKIGDKVKITGTNFLKDSTIYIKKTGDTVDKIIDGLNPNSSGKQIQFKLPEKICAGSTCENVVSGVYNIKVGSVQGVSNLWNLTVGSIVSGSTDLCPDIDGVQTVLPCSTGSSYVGPAILSFVADPVVIGAGENTKLSWKTDVEATCSVSSKAGENIPSETSSPSTTGYRWVTVSKDSKYTLTCKNSAGLSSTKTVDVDVVDRYVRNVRVNANNRDTIDLSSGQLLSVWWETNIGATRPVTITFVKSDGKRYKFGPYTNKFTKDSSGAYYASFDVTMLKNKGITAGEYNIEVSILRADEKTNKSVSSGTIKVVSGDSEDDPVVIQKRATVSNLKFTKPAGVVSGSAAGNTVSLYKCSGAVCQTDLTYGVSWSVSVVPDGAPFSGRLVLTNPITGATVYVLKEISSLSAGSAEFTRARLRSLPVANGYYSLKIVSSDSSIVTSPYINVQIKNAP